MLTLIKSNIGYLVLKRRPSGVSNKPRCYVFLRESALSCRQKQLVQVIFVTALEWAVALLARTHFIPSF